MAVRGLGFYIEGFIMATCLECEKDLPFKCTCNISDKQKLKNYFKKADAHLKLCEAILFKGYKPKILINSDKKPLTSNMYYCKSSLTSKGIELFISIQMSTEYILNEIILRGLNNELLYKFSKRLDPIRIDEKDMLHITLNLNLWE